MDSPFAVDLNTRMWDNTHTEKTQRDQMNNYLVIYFNRYDTTKSQHNTVVSNGPQEALYKDVCNRYSSQLDPDEIEREYQFLLETYEEVSDTFSCVSLEENDYLIYKIS